MSGWWVKSALVALVLLGASPADAAPKRLEAGKQAPSFMIRAPDGEMVKLDDLAYQGKERAWAKKRPLLLDFFRTDCQPCINALPELVSLAEKHREAGLQVVMVALLEDKDGPQKLDRFLAERKLPFKVVVDATSSVAEKYLGNPAPLPATFLIDRSGVLKKSKYDAKGSLEAHFAPELEAVLADHRSQGAKP